MVFFACHPPNSKLINVNPVHQLKITGNTLQPYEITGFLLKFRRIGYILPTIFVKLELLFGLFETTSESNKGRGGIGLDTPARNESKLP